MRAAPNGDIFVAETAAGRIRVLPPDQRGTAASENGYSPAASNGPFGIAFYPADNPAMGLCRQHEFGGALCLSGGRPEGERRARDHRGKVADGRRAFDPRRRVLPGRIETCSSRSARRPMMRRAWEARSAPPSPMGAGQAAGRRLGRETERADVLVFDPQGKGRRVFATGIRNCVGMAVNPTAGDLWCSTNERDGLGDNLPPDYLTRVREGALLRLALVLYRGRNEDPRHAWRASGSRRTRSPFRTC